MDAGKSAGDARTTVEWRRIAPDGISPPVVRWLPYVELKLEHPDLEPSGYGDRFFPDAVPYELDGTPRVFYWHHAIVPSAAEPRNWELVCATTHGLVGFDSLPAGGPSLVTECASGTILVVDGTVGGDSTTSRVASYSAPEIFVGDRSEGRMRLTINGTEYGIPAGDRRRIRLPEQYVEPVDTGGESTTVTPELVVRYPGRRELHHPARDATYRLFPSFGLDLNAIPNPLPVPTTADELDDTALAADLNVGLSQRPYPERVLWRAFAYTAFDPHTDAMPELTQLGTDHIVLRTGDSRTE